MKEKKIKELALNWLKNLLLKGPNDFRISLFYIIRSQIVYKI